MITHDQGAVGISPRDFDLKEKGNFTDFVYTERELLDGAVMMGDCIKRLKGDIDVYNASNGLYINHTISRKLSDYQVSSSKSFKKDKHVAIQNYWSQLSIYTKSDLNSRWNACSPRKQAQFAMT